MKKIVLTDEETKQVINLYTEDKWGMSKIGEHLGGYSRVLNIKPFTI